MRSVVPVAAFVLVVALSFPTKSSAAIDEKVPDAQSIAALELKASQAQPKEQCYLYAELVHQMIEFSAAQYASGEFESAAATLKHVGAFAQKIHIAVSNDERRLKNAQILLRHTSFRLNELLHASSMEDRPLVQETLAQVNQIQTEAMMQVFRK
jgi:hypothetical protein